MTSRNPDGRGAPCRGVGVKAGVWPAREAPPLPQATPQIIPVGDSALLCCQSQAHPARFGMPRPLALSVSRVAPPLARAAPHAGRGGKRTRRVGMGAVAVTSGAGVAAQARCAQRRVEAAARSRRRGRGGP